MARILSTLKSRISKDPVFYSAMLIVLAVLLFYSNSFHADWHYDDFHHIKENINIRKISNIPRFFSDPTTFSRNPNTRMYRPLLMATHAINYRLGILTTRDGYNEVGYHVVNLLFHLVSSLAVFFIVLFLFRMRLPDTGLDPLLPAVFSGLLFGLQTINTETIVYISSRSSGMATMFVLLAFLAYLKGTERSENTRYGLIILSVGLYFCGMLSKEIAITLPAMLLFYELLLNRPEALSVWNYPFIQRIIGRLTPFAVTGLIFLLIRHAVIQDNILRVLTKKGGTPAAKNLVSQLATQSRAWVYYIREWLWPTSLSIDKPFAVSRNFENPKVLLAVLVILCILFAAFRIRKRHPIISFGAFWYFTALLPTTLIRLNVPINDHRLYLPGLGAVLVFTYIGSLLYVRFRADGGFYFRGFVALCVAVLLFMGLGTLKRNMAFATEESMWKDVILKDRKSVRGYNNLGIWYEQNGMYEKALSHYQQTIKLAPMFPNPYINIGNVYHKQKKFEPAEKWMKRAIQLDPKSALANYNLGNILREAGKTKGGIDAYKRALVLNPRYIEAANNLANIYFKSRNYPEAIRYYQQALFIDPTFAMSYYNIALANERMGRFDEAIVNFEKFLRFWLGDVKYSNLARKKIEALQARNSSGPP